MLNILVPVLDLGTSLGKVKSRKCPKKVWKRSLTPSLLNDAYMRHTFKCTGCGTTHICVNQLNMPGAD